jgi:hypothetical protein
MQTPSLFQVNIISTYKAASMVRVRQKIDDRFNPKKFEKKKFGQFIIGHESVGWKIQFGLGWYRRVRVEEIGPAVPKPAYISKSKRRILY